MSRPRAGSLCTGYGGLDLAVHAVLGGELAWVSEIDPGAAAILACRFPGVPNHGDLTTVDWAAVEPVDILAGGFPCQDVSAAGKRAGLQQGNRSGLWLEIVRAIGMLRPRLVIIENVRGLLTARGDEPTTAHLKAEAAADTALRLLHWLGSEHNIATARGDIRRARQCAARTARVMGLRKQAVARCQWHERRLVRAIGTVLGSLADLGYDARWTVVSASDAGAPHRRERVFITAWPAEDADRAASGEWRQSAPGQAPGGRPRADAGRPGGAPAAADAHRGGHEGAEPAGAQPGREAAAAVGRRPADQPGTTAADAERDRQPGRPESTTRAADKPGEGPRAETPRRSAGAPADARSEGRERPRPGPAGRTIAARSTAGHAESIGRRTAGQQRRLGAAQPVTGDIAWGAYAAAIARWEHVTGRPAPRPTEPGRSGQRLSPAFVEWMMGLPPGWVTDVPGLTRNAQLKALGNGVVWQQAAEALRRLEAAA